MEPNKSGKSGAGGDGNMRMIDSGSGGGGAKVAGGDGNMRMVDSGNGGAKAASGTGGARAMKKSMNGGVSG